MILRVFVSCGTMGMVRFDAYFQHLPISIHLPRNAFDRSSVFVISFSHDSLQQERIFCIPKKSQKLLWTCITPLFSGTFWYIVLLVELMYNDHDHDRALNPTPTDGPDGSCFLVFRLSCFGVLKSSATKIYEALPLGREPAGHVAMLAFC